MNRKLKAAIVEKFGTQYAFADAANLHESQVSSFIRGREPHPNVATKKRLAGLLGVGIDVFETEKRFVAE